jgi:hypothetical protein
MRFLAKSLLVAAMLSSLLSTPQRVVGQAYKDEVGFTRLAAEVGPSLVNGDGVNVGIVEARVGGNYLVNPASSQFAGKTIIDGSGLTSEISGHANAVAIRQFGNMGSMTPGVTTITNYEANDWVGRILGNAAGVAPAPQPFSVMNHSYIGNGYSTAEAVEINRRIDFLAERDNITHTVGLNNGTGNIPQIFGQSYNTIVVGRSDGNHSAGLTTLNGAGRVKPDIVAPQTTVSNAAPIVSSAAILLRAQGAAAGNTDAIHNEVTKAVLMAGATKTEFSSWANTSTRPLDERYGVGELNIYNSYRIMEAGEIDGLLTDPPANANLLGWDYGENINSGEELFYNFDLDRIAEASFLLTWNAQISDSGGDLDYDTLELTDLNMRLYDSTGSFAASIVGESLSTVDNVEHLYFTDLAAGRYTLGVSGLAGPSTDFGLAWRITAVPEPSSVALLAMFGSLYVVRRSRRNPR